MKDTNRHWTPLTAVAPDTGTSRIPPNTVQTQLCKLCSLALACATGRHRQDWKEDIVVRCFHAVHAELRLSLGHAGKLGAVAVAAECLLSAFLIMSPFELQTVSDCAHSGWPDPRPLKTDLANCNVAVRDERICRLLKGLGSEACSLYVTTCTAPSARTLRSTAAS